MRKGTGVKRRKTRNPRKRGRFRGDAPAAGSVRRIAVSVRAEDAARASAASNPATNGSTRAAAPAKADLDAAVS